MSRQGKIRVVVSLVVALVVLAPLGLRWQAQWNLHSYRKKLIAAGEKLTVEELAPKSSGQATNTARFLKLVSSLPPPWGCTPTAMRAIKPGVARVAWRQPRCMEQTDDNKQATDVWPAFIDVVRTNEQIFRELRSLVDAGGIELIKCESQSIVNVSARAILSLHQSHMDEALLHLKTCGAGPQLATTDPTMSGQYVRYACIYVAARGYWEALQASGWTDKQTAHFCSTPWAMMASIMEAILRPQKERGRIFSSGGIGSGRALPPTKKCGFSKRNKANQPSADSGYALNKFAGFSEAGRNRPRGRQSSN